MKILIMKFLALMLIVSFVQAQQLGRQMQDQWCFESREKPLENKGNASGSTGQVVTRNGESFADGIAIIGGGRDGILQFNSNVLSERAYTIWFRFKFEPEMLKQLSDNGALPFAMLENLEISLFTAKGKKEDILFGLSGQVDGISINPGMSATLSPGSWVQVALLKGKSGMRVYYREEAADKNKAYWIYLGMAPLKETKVGNQSMLFGNLSDVSYSNLFLHLDELRSYSIELNEHEMFQLWPSLWGFATPPKQPFGVVIDHSPAYSGRYVGGSPSIVKLEDGTYLAKGDDYGPAVGRSELARIYRSVDKGKTWEEISQVEGTTWASLFTHNGDVYLLGTSAGHRFGHVVIMKSTDGGETWTKPNDSTTGLLKEDLSYHTAPVPVVVYNGRIWRSMEDEKGGGAWGKTFRAMMMSAPVDSDLLNAKNWVFSEPIGYNQDWLDGKFNGILEGNAVVSPDGTIINLLRVDITNGGGKAALISYKDGGKLPVFDPESDFIDFPGGSTKFHVLYDSLSASYWALSNAVLAKHQNHEVNESLVRNTLVLMKSPDLKQWCLVDTILYHPDVAKHGFQYPSFVFDGDDMVFVSRTAYEDGVGGAYRQHDSNYFTFHRIERFRDIKK